MSKWQNYIAPNLGLLFYKRVYKDIPINLLDIKEEKLIFKVNDKNSEFNDFYKDIYEKSLESYPKTTVIENCICFTLYTTYPGLLVGSGYAHGTKTTGDASIGFFFDHTTGLPIIPGSSVKGVLRSLFEIDINENSNNEFTGKKSLAALQFILNELLKSKENIECFSELRNSLDENKLKVIKQEIFGDDNNDGRDIFYDAIIDFEKTKVNKFIGSDFITPHQPNFLKNPTPIQFLKVLPNIGFKFQFKLTGSENITAKQKELLFKQILLIIGAGAKTNVGYGQFSTHDNQKEENAQELNPGKTFNTIIVGDELNAKISDLISGITIDLGFADMNFKPKLLGLSPKSFKIGQMIKVKVDALGKQAKFSLINTQ